MAQRKTKIGYINANQTIFYNYLRAYDIPRVGRISTTYPGSGAVEQHTLGWHQFNDISGSLL